MTLDAISKINKEMPVTQVVEINEISLKTLTPLSSVNEQAVVLDEYGIHLAQFSIAINRVLGAVRLVPVSRTVLKQFS